MGRRNLPRFNLHGIGKGQAEEAPLNDQCRLLAVILTERGENVRVITAYDLDAGQRRDYYKMRELGE